MCVIAIVEHPDKRPTIAEIDAMWKANFHGGGVAWQADGKVHWRKGLTLRDMQVQIAELPTPFIVHFRISSCGDGGIPQLTHPFLIEKGSPIALEGSTESSLLFHNGHWGGWEQRCREWLGYAGGKIKAPADGQRWSDSRAMAFWAFYYGTGIFEPKSPWDINEKVVIMSPTEIEIFNSGWSKRNGYIVSNTWWESKLPKIKVEPKILPKPFDPIQPTRPDGRLPQHYVDSSGGLSSLKEVAPTIHPFEVARQEYETAVVAYHTFLPGSKKREGSKNQMKKKAKLFWKASAKYPEMAQKLREKEHAEVISAAEAQMDRMFTSVENRLPS